MKGFKKFPYVCSLFFSVLIDYCLTIARFHQDAETYQLIAVYAHFKILTCIDQVITTHFFLPIFIV